MEEFVYWAHPTAVGIRVEEVSGGGGRSPKAWLPMARQIFAENGKNGVYREIYHTESGAPLLEDSTQRISVSHAPGLLVVAMLPSTPEADLEKFSLRTALGVDTERKDRSQVVKIREKFLSDEELAMIPADDIELNILAWTAKEAIFKAILSEGVDFRKDIRIESLPELADYPLQKKPAGHAIATRHTADRNGTEDSENRKPETIRLELFAYRSDDHIVCLAYSDKCAKYKS